MKKCKYPAYAYPIIQCYATLPKMLYHRGSVSLSCSVHPLHYGGA